MRNMPALTPDERRAISALRRLQEAWPKTLWIQADGNRLSVMRTNDDGRRAYRPDDRLDRDYLVEQFTIPNDGGDPW